jgi:hypothetical protein
MGQTGYLARRTPGSFRWTGQLTEWELQSASEFTRATRPEVPLSGPRLAVGDPARLPFFVAEPEGTAFHQFFGLRPPRPEAAREEPPSFESLAGVLEQENEQFINERRTQALAAFKRATRPDVEDVGEALSQARALLTAVRDLDRDAYLPSLLLVHVALQRGTTLLAVCHLADAVRRHPAFFVERPDLALYFAQPAVLEEQMRRNLRIGDETPGQPGVYALQAYCAWVLNDRARVTYALDQLAAADQEGELDAKAKTVLYALRAATR